MYTKCSLVLTVCRYWDKWVQDVKARYPSGRHLM